MERQRQDEDNGKDRRMCKGKKITMKRVKDKEENKHIVVEN